MRLPNVIILVDLITLLGLLHVDVDGINCCFVPRPLPGSRFSVTLPNPKGNPTSAKRLSKTKMGAVGKF